MYEQIKKSSKMLSHYVLELSSSQTDVETDGRTDGHGYINFSCLHDHKYIYMSIPISFPFDRYKLLYKYNIPQIKNFNVVYNYIHMSIKNMQNLPRNQKIIPELNKIVNKQMGMLSVI